MMGAVGYALMMMLISRIAGSENGIPKTFYMFSIIAALFVEAVIVSSLLGVLGASLIWSIGELFHQRRRVKKGWFPMNPKRKHEYED